MAWWTLLPAAAGVVTSYLNRPKREDYKTDVSSYQRYIANLYNQVGKRDVYRQAMEPGLRAVGRAASQSRREMGYELSRMGMADSGAAVQANLSLTDKYLQQVGDIASQAIAQEEQYRRRALGEASRVESQIGQIKAQDKQSYERARSQWSRDMIGQALGLGASAVTQGLQTSQYKKELLAAADVADEVYGLAGSGDQVAKPVAEPQPTLAQSPTVATAPLEEPSAGVSRDTHQIKQMEKHTSDQGVALKASREDKTVVQPETKAVTQMSISEGMSKIMDKYPNMSPQFYQNAMSTLVERKAQEKNVQNTMTYVNAMRDIHAGEPVDLAKISESLSPQMTISLAEAQMAQDPAIKTKKIVDSFMQEGLDPNMFKDVKDVNEAVNLVHQNTLKLYAKASEGDLTYDEIINNDTVPMDARIKAMELVAKSKDKGYTEAFVEFLESGMDIEKLTEYYPEMTKDEQTQIKDMLRIKNEKTAGGINGDNIKDIIYDYSLVLKRAGEISTQAEMETDDEKARSYKASADKLYNLADRELDKLYEYQDLTEMGININYGEYLNLKSDIKTLVYQAQQDGLPINEAFNTIKKNAGFIPDATLRKWISE